MLRIGIDSLDEQGKTDRFCELELLYIKTEDKVIKTVFITSNDDDYPPMCAKFDYQELLTALHYLEKLDKTRVE